MSPVATPRSPAVVWVLALAIPLAALACAPATRGPVDHGVARPPASTPAWTMAEVLAQPEPRLSVWAACEIARDVALPSGDPARVGGLSGLTLDPGSGTWLVVSDDPETPRWYRLAMHVGEASCRAEVTATVRVQRQAPGGSGSIGSDFEDIALLANGEVLLASEGDTASRAGTPPGLHRFDGSGRWLGALSLRERFLVAADGRSGVRHNAAFESLTVTPDERRLFTATEQPLVQDGSPSTFSRGGVARLLEYVAGADGFQPAREFALPIAAIPHPRELRPERAEIGVVALLALDADTLLMMERTFVSGLRDGERAGHNDVLISRVRLTHADDVSGEQSLREWLRRPVEKRVIFSLGDVASQLPAWLAGLDNFEGLAWGPRLPDGTGSLVLISDDNFSARQRSAIVLLRVASR